MLSPARRERIATAVRDFCAVRQQASAPQLTAATTDLARLKRQERKLLDAHYEDRVSDELFKEEEQRIRRQRVAAEATIARLHVNDEQLLATVDEALAMTDRIQTAYRRANPKQRRLFNQALFETIWIDREDVAASQLAAPFDDLTANDLLRELSEARVRQPALNATALTVRLDPDGDAWAANTDTGHPAPALATVGASTPKTQTGDPIQRSPVRTSEEWWTPWALNLHTIWRGG